MPRVASRSAKTAGARLGRRLMAQRPIFPSDFRVLFRAMARAAVASSFVASGCDAPKVTRHEAPGDAAVPWTGDWVSLVCDEKEWPLEQANLERSIDYLGWYSVDRHCMSDPLWEPHRGELGLYGTPCSGASDREACLGSVRRIVDDCEEACPDILIATAGDEVIRYQGRAGTDLLLGAVDTEIDAALAAYVAGAVVICVPPGTDPEEYGTRIRAIDAGFEVETRWDRTGASGTAQTLVTELGHVVERERPAFGYNGFCGRRPAGLLHGSLPVACSEAGDYFASCAHLEAASVLAFEQLARDLARLGAPRGLVEQALRSALEEVGHARIMGALAERFGSESIRARVAPLPERPALAIAIENATEGCVRETFGALVACYQAQASPDRRVRAAMARIAEDETRHAELSWRIAEWLEPSLSEAEQAAICAARSAAFAELQRAPLPKLSHEARRLIGMPDEATASTLLAQLRVALDLCA